MTFKKNHEYRWKPEGSNALDPNPICFKLSSEMKEQLKAIPNWQKKLRDNLPELMQRWKSEIGNSDAPSSLPLR